jgi:multiple sugar transport system substrate-binding protein
VTGGFRRGRRRTGSLLAAGLFLAGGLLAGCDLGSSSTAQNGPASPTSSTTSSGPLRRETLTFGVFGTPDEVAAYQQMTTLFGSATRRVTVKVESWPDHTSMLDAFKNGAPVPDVFLASRRDLLWLHQHQAVQPVDGLLDDRGVDFGDDYPRDSLTAFARDNNLLCLPYDIDPTVIFYNKALVKFGRMKVDPPAPGQGWSLSQFEATAHWAQRHHPGVSGLYVDPTLEGISPFLYSGGGQLYDDPNRPTSLALSSDSSRTALAQAMVVLGRRDLTLTPQELLQRTPLEWFERGKLAMIEGDRSLVPTLRQVLGLDFDVMPMPSLGTAATVGGMTGLCISHRTTDVNTAADFVVYASSPAALGQVASEGSLQPANQAVALSPDFQQPGHLPKHASVFTFGVKSMVIPPLVDKWDQLDQAIDPQVARLFTTPITRIPAITRLIDRESRTILAPPGGPNSPTSGASTQSPGS